ncbi:drug/metabolite transporter (DMT)-like permease [Neorhizobium sp. 2083]|uniref:DMT family transporter n=1 Tax=Neorhizobium sp. 2083 TaxID=2817762 RepID=UPI00286428F8|nr:DMT family transporter [Neorhizobium sp. 2083]MDR6815020.1 drug/metabolite transporter (DMT)-like permease [Neorhizobium sp. 2083]
MNDHTKGLVLTSIGGLALSFDVPLVRLGQGEMWSTVAVRSTATFAAAILLWLLVRRFGSSRPVLIPGKAGLAAGFCYGISTIAFLGAVFNTATANVVFIVASTPMYAAILGWLILKERPSPSTLIAMLVMFSGVGLIVSGGLAGGHILGDTLATTASFLLALAITLSRAARIDMGFVPLVATIIPAAVGLSFVGVSLLAGTGGFSIANPFWVLFDGAIMMPLAFWCLATGPKYLSGSEVGMFYLLETILAPIWVWLIFSEVPSSQTLLGGSILVLALIGYSAWQMRRV